MEIRTALLIFLAAIAALTIVFYQYFFKNTQKGTLKIVLAALRFVVIFCAFLLLINPKFVDTEYFLEKSNLVLLMDDSESMQKFPEAQNLSEEAKKILEDERVKERFDSFQFVFGSELDETDTLSFENVNTDIANAITKMDELFLNGTNTLVLFSDGNQTLGRDYEFLNVQDKLRINSVVVGDTTSYDDLSIDRINANNYTFLGNKFPVEVIVAYSGSGNVTKNLSIRMDGKRIFQKNLTFTANQNSQNITTLIEAENVGLKSLDVQIASLENEKNLTNNTKQVAFEVIDEKTNVTLVADMLHPDIGALKKAVESNEQRNLDIVGPDVKMDVLRNTDVLILYQPKNTFRRIYDFVKTNTSNLLTITGTQTNWNFLNQIQPYYFKEDFEQKEEILPVLNKSFSTFGLGGFDTSDYPPLLSNLGDLEILVNHENILYQQIKGVDLDKPLLSLINTENRKEAVLFGDNIWRWRVKNYLDTIDFKDFDDFVGKLMLFLNSSGKRSRLELDYKTVYEGSTRASIKANYFAESNNLAPNGSLTITIKGTDVDYSREAPMLFKGSFHEYDLSNLNAGSYRFTIKETGAKISKTGSFRILDFKPENQRYSANYKKLERVAKKTGGKLYYPDNLEIMVDDLLESEHAIPVQKSRQNVVSLIDFRILLGIMALCLAFEWFIRKYNGLI